MPNWVNCGLEVRGDEVFVDKFVKEQRTMEGATEVSLIELDFNVVKPEPVWTEQQKKESAWYEWRISNWGTKWHPNEIQKSVDNKLFGGLKEAVYGFDTAWNYPDEWLKACGKKYPHLEFFLSWEEEQGFTGVHQVMDGETVYTDSCDVPEFRISDGELDDSDEAVEEYAEAIQQNLYEMRSRRIK